MINTLRKAVSKQIELTSSEDWKKQLFMHAPPILWFGNSNAKRKILTIGANPSRWEVVKKDLTMENRFRMLHGNELLNDILTDDKLANEIIDGYNEYFSKTKNPYTAWFGKNNSPYKVECFLQGFGATFYEMKDLSYNCIHVDMFPFPTMDDYNKLYDIVIPDLFKNGWSTEILCSIITFINPEKIIVFGRGNTDALFTYILAHSNRLVWKKITNGKASFIQEMIKISERKYPCLCISTNLGNPKPFSKDELFEFGKEMRERV